MKKPILTQPQHVKVYEHIKFYPHCTYEQIRQKTKIRKPCMRVSEINRLWRQQNGIEDSDMQIIVTVGTNKYREALKSIARI